MTISIARSTRPCTCGPSRARSSQGAAACASCDGAPKDAASAAVWRTIYYWAADDGVCYMLYLYAKNEQGDLTATQLRALARVVREEFK